MCLTFDPAQTTTALWPSHMLPVASCQLPIGFWPSCLQVCQSRRLIMKLPALSVSEYPSIRGYLVIVFDFAF